MLLEMYELERSMQREAKPGRMSCDFDAVARPASHDDPGTGRGALRRSLGRFLIRMGETIQGQPAGRNAVAPLPLAAITHKG